MTPLKHIAIITAHYPSSAHPNRGTFVQQLVCAFAELGVRCTVIHPWKLHNWLRDRGKEPYVGSKEDGQVQVLRPLTLSLSNKRLGRFNTFAITYANFRRATWRTLQSLDEKPDAIYGHFLYPSGAAAVWASQRSGKPGFVSVGESFDLADHGLWSLRDFAPQVSKHHFDLARGFVTVSGSLHDQLVTELGVPREKICVFPNGVDSRLFRPLDRVEMRQKHGLPQDRFLVVFVGTFDERKGAQRVNSALAVLPQVGGIFIGNGPLRPQGDQVLFCGVVAHQQVPELLCAADVFVLPSRAEGCSNATLEAMACGLPVVVSARTFNEEICDRDTALLIEPDDLEAIRNAIMKLQSNSDLRKRLAAAALSRAALFDIRARARGILEWMGERINASRHVAAPALNSAPCGRQEGALKLT